MRASLSTCVNIVSVGIHFLEPFWHSPTPNWALPCSYFNSLNQSDQTRLVCHIWTTALQMMVGWQERIWVICISLLQKPILVTQNNDKTGIKFLLRFRFWMKIATLNFRCLLKSLAYVTWVCWRKFKTSTKCWHTFFGGNNACNLSLTTAI